MEAKKVMSDAMVLKKYFGTLPGETTSQFMAELKDLSPEAKKELADMARPYVSDAAETPETPDTK